MSKAKEQFTVPSPLLAAARMMQAKEDVRYYLQGVRINKDRISGTSGHYLFDCPMPESYGDGIGGELILALEDAVPRHAKESHFERISKTEFVVRHKDKHGREIKASVAKVVDGKFPDISKLTDKLAGKLVGVKEIAFNMAYAELINRVFKRIGSKEAYGLELSFRGQTELIEIRPACQELDFKEAYVLLMPTRMAR